MSIFQIQAKDAVVRIGTYDALNCVQNFNWDSAFNAEQLSQLGDVAYDAQTITPEVTPSFEVRSTGSLTAFLSRMIYTLNDVSGEFEGYLGTANTNLIRESDLERAICDLIESKKANEVFDRSTLFPRSHLSSFSLSANTDGTATEQYQFESDVLEIFRAPKHDLVALPVTRKTGSETTTVLLPVDFDVELGSTVATAEWKVYALDIDGIRVDAADLVLTTDDVAGDELALSAGAQANGISIPKGSKLSLLIYRKTPGAFPTITYPTSARFVKADQIDIWLVDPTATFTVAGTTDTVENLLAAGKDFNLIPFTQSDLLLRVQSIDMSVDLGREALKEIRKNDRGNPIYYRAATYPLNITSSVSMLETDLSEWQKLQHANGTDVLNLAKFENQTWCIITRYYKAGTPLQTVGLLDARVDNPGNSIAARGRATLKYDFTASKFAAQGAAV